MARQLTSAQSAEFKRSVSALKKAGILPKRVKVRSALPSKVVDGKTLSEYVKKFKLATPEKNAAEIVKVTRPEALKFKKLGYTIQGDRVMVPRTKDYVVSVYNGEITVTDKRNGIEQVHVPIQYHNLSQYLSDMQVNSKEIQRMKRANERFAFKFFGHNSVKTFRSIEHLIEDLIKYDSIQESLRKRNASEARELYQNLVIVKVPFKERYDFMKDRQVTQRPRNRKGKAESRKLWPGWKKEQYKAKRRLEEQKRRDKKKGKV